MDGNLLCGGLRHRSVPFPANISSIWPSIAPSLAPSLLFVCLAVCLPLCPSVCISVCLPASGFAVSQLVHPLPRISACWRACLHNYTCTVPSGSPASPTQLASKNGHTIYLHRCRHSTHTGVRLIAQFDLVPFVFEITHCLSAGISSPLVTKTTRRSPSSRSECIACCSCRDSYCNRALAIVHLSQRRDDAHVSGGARLHAEKCSERPAVDVSSVRGFVANACTPPSLATRQAGQSKFFVRHKLQHCPVVYRGLPLRTSAKSYRDERLPEACGRSRLASSMT